MKILKIILIVSCLAGWSSIVLAEDVVVIVNKNSTLANISEKEIGAIYLGEKRFIGDTKVVPIDLKKGNIMERFLASVIQMTPRDYRIHWSKKIFQDGLQPPVSKTSAQEVIEMVKNEQGAIGYVDKASLKGESEISIIKEIK